MMLYSIPLPNAGKAKFSIPYLNTPMQTTITLIPLSLHLSHLHACAGCCPLPHLAQLSTFLSGAALGSSTVGQAGFSFP